MTAKPAALPASVDIAIVGAGPAGIATAASLVRCDPAWADRIVVLERSAFPRDKICAGGLGARADQTLARLDLDAQVPSAPIHGICLRLPAGTRTVRAAEPIGRVVRRRQLDHALARSVARKDVRVIEGAWVQSLEPDGKLIRLRTSLGDLRARAVVGADGVGSVVRRALGLPRGELWAQAVEVDTDEVRQDEPRDILHFESMDRGMTGYCWDFPTIVDGEAKVCRGAYVLRWGPSPMDPSRALDAHLASRGFSPPAFAHRRYAERGYVRATPFSRPGWLLVGEAAGIDPVAGEGIPQALLYGELAGRYLHERFSAHDLRFDDWSRRVASAFFGKDLRFRSAMAGMFYGRDRPWLERVLVERPWFLRSGVEYFAGRRVPRAWLARLMWFAARLWLGARLSESG